MSEPSGWIRLTERDVGRSSASTRTGSWSGGVAMSASAKTSDRRRRRASQPGPPRPCRRAAPTGGSRRPAARDAGLGTPGPRAEPGPGQRSRRRCRRRRRALGCGRAGRPRRRPVAGSLAAPPEVAEELVERRPQPILLVVGREDEREDEGRGGIGARLGRGRGVAAGQGQQLRAHGRRRRAEPWRSRKYSGSGWSSVTRGPGPANAATWSPARRTSCGIRRPSCRGRGAANRCRRDVLQDVAPREDLADARHRQSGAGHPSRACRPR